jgi:hypothetical protein
MKYYLTKYVLKRSITGSDWQTRSAPQSAGRDWFDDPLNFTQIKYNEFPNFVPKAYFELDEKGKYTDVIYISNTKTKGFLVSPRLKQLWDNFKVFDHRYYPAKVAADSGEIREYFLFHMAAQELPGIDYEKSVFNDYRQLLETRDDGSQTFGEVKISRLAERRIRTVPPRELYLKKIYFTQDFPDYDLFYIPFFMVREEFFISEQLVDAMKKEKITGLAYDEQNIIDEFFPLSESK